MGDLEGEVGREKNHMSRAQVSKRYRSNICLAAQEIGYLRMYFSELGDLTAGEGTLFPGPTYPWVGIMQSPVTDRRDLGKGFCRP